MLLSQVGRCAVLFHLLAVEAGAAPAFIRGAAGGVGAEEPAGHHHDARVLYDCAQHTKNKFCPTGPNDHCAWIGGDCVLKPTTPPPTPNPTDAPVTAPPTSSPTASPSAPPTTGPTVAPTAAPLAGAGHCSDDGSVCFAIDECLCSSSGGAPADQPAALFVRRRALNSCAATKRKDCPTGSGLCAWNGRCVSTTSQPTVPPGTDSPSGSPTTGPTGGPTTSPTKAPTGAPTPCACLGLPPTTPQPTDAPSKGPSASPTGSPTPRPTSSPSAGPTTSPSAPPTPMPSGSPSKPPTLGPSGSPSTSPSKTPTNSPSRQPSDAPTEAPTRQPSTSPTKAPSNAPSTSPTSSPSRSPETSAPSKSPTDGPTRSPSVVPSKAPTNLPTALPTNVPTANPTDAPTGNLLQNPGFEDGLTSWYANSGTIAIDTNEVYSGSQAVYASGRTNTWMGPQQDMTALQPNFTYRVSCWAKLKGNLASTDSFLLTMRIVDDNGSHWNGVTATINDSTWTKVEGDILVDVTGSLTSVEFFAEGPQPGEDFWVDDMSIVSLAPTTAVPTKAPTPNPTKAPSTSENLVLNPGFEDGLTNWFANSGNQSIAVDTNEVYSGSQSMYASSRILGAWQGPQQTVTEVLQPNSLYRVSCWAKLKGNLASTDSLQLTLRIVDDNGAHWNVVTATINDTTWTKVEGDLVVDVTGSLTSVLFTAKGPQPGEDFWVDDMSIVFLSSAYGDGPFVTLATSSELVTIPRPPAPNSVVQSNCPHWEAGLLSWHDPATWGGVIPAAGESVTLPANSKVVMSQAVVEELGVVTVPSTSELIFDENASAPITLDVAGMEVFGALRAGSDICPYITELTITLHGSRPTDLDQYGKSDTAVPSYKGISVNGGIISMHGKKHYPTWSRLAESVASGQTYLLIQEQVDWEVGQEVVLTTTAIHDSREYHQNEVLTISSVVDNPVPGVGSAVHFTSPTQFAHIANTGYQAEVGLLSRNIRVQGAADDSEATDPDSGGCSGNYHFGTSYKPCPWTYTTGFGGHIMVHSGGKGYMEGVELFRMGQTNILGRYPFHWHLLENECADCFFRSNSIHRSFYRCISIHGTHNTTVSENVAYDVNGYCYYLEDGIEQDNTISYNLAAHIHPVSNVVANADDGIQGITPFSQSKDLILPADVTASGYYITNLANTIVGNAASGGWSGFALPVLERPIGPSRNVNMRPGNRLTNTFNGNTAHSTGWWWTHAGAFYSGGSLYYSITDNTLLEYNAGRDQSKGGRSPCLVDKCITANNCEAYCPPGEQAWYRLTNSKVFLTASPGLNSWSGRTEVVGFETHDVALGLEALESGFGISNLLVDCRSGEDWVMGIPNGRPQDVTANGFFWYDTGQEHIITSATFRNCGARSSSNAYDTSPTRGCDTNPVNGCYSGSTVWGMLTHSDWFTPEIMQATRGITYEDCGRRFKLVDYADDNAISSVSGRNQNWMDVDGSVSELNEPVIIGSGLSDAGKWWQADDDVVYDPEGPLKFIKVNNGPERGLGHIRLRWNDGLHNTVGSSSCFNGPKGTTSNPLCPAVGRIRHIGQLYDQTNDPTGGLPVTANAEVAGLVGGFGWVLQLDDGPPKNLRIDQIEVDSSTPLLLAIPYPTGTSFTVTANAAYCYSSSSRSCAEQFTAADSIAHVRHSSGNTYYYDSATQLLYVRIIQFPQTYTGDPNWHLWTIDDPNTLGGAYALDRFSFDGITLPKFAYGPYLEITADCTEGSVSGHCGSIPTYVEPVVCPQGFVQTAYDKCCVSPGSNDCYEMTAPPTAPPTPAPTFGPASNLVLNPGFEAGLSNWYANSGTIELETIEVHSGSQAVLAKDRTATWMGPQQTMTDRLQPNVTYHVSCWAKLRTPGTDVSLGLTMRIEDDNPSPHYRGFARPINDSTWTKVEGNILVDVTGSMNAVYLYAQEPAVGAEFWIDDCSVVAV